VTLKSDMRASLAQLKSRSMREIGQILNAIGPDKLRAALDRLLIGGSAGTLLVHSALSSCGRFTAGPDNVLEVLHEYCGTLCVPTFTYCYPESAQEAGPLFDASVTPSKMGLLTERFRYRTDARRSIHATHSLAAAGPLAAELCAGHYQQDAPCGARSPFSRLLELNASVLLIGVNFSAYTLYHTAEDESDSDFAYERGTIDWLRVVDEAGVPRDCLSRRQARNPRRFALAGDLLEVQGLAKRVALGHGFLRYVPDSAKVHDFLLQRLRRSPDFLYESSTAALQ
jgi:aminoglycoside 3-N-acetyltransferase